MVASGVGVVVAALVWWIWLGSRDSLRLRHRVWAVLIGSIGAASGVCASVVVQSFGQLGVPPEDSPGIFYLLAFPWLTFAIAAALSALLAIGFAVTGRPR